MDGELVHYGSSPQSNREVVLVVLVVLTLLVLFLFLLLLEFFYSQHGSWGGRRATTPVRGLNQKCMKFIIKTIIYAGSRGGPT